MQTGNQEITNVLILHEAGICQYSCISRIPAGSGYDGRGTVIGTR
jgi:hypothetical protein